MFTAFFVMSGNFLRMPSVNGFLTKIIAGNELWLSALASQLLTNNPVALVFPTFQKYRVADVRHKYRKIRHRPFEQLYGNEP